MENATHKIIIRVIMMFLMSPEALAVCIGDNILATHALRTMTEHEFAKYCEQQGVLNVIKKTGKDGKPRNFTVWVQGSYITTSSWLCLARMAADLKVIQRGSFDEQECLNFPFLGYDPIRANIKGSIPHGKFKKALAAALRHVPLLKALSNAHSAAVEKAKAALTAAGEDPAAAFDDDLMDMDVVEDDANPDADQDELVDSDNEHEDIGDEEDDDTDEKENAGSAAAGGEVAGLEEAANTNALAMTADGVAGLAAVEDLAGLGAADHASLGDRAGMNSAEHNDKQDQLVNTFSMGEELADQLHALFTKNNNDQAQVPGTFAGVAGSSGDTGEDKACTAQEPETAVTTGDATAAAAVEQAGTSSPQEIMHISKQDAVLHELILQRKKDKEIAMGEQAQLVQKLAGKHHENAVLQASNMALAVEIASRKEQIVTLSEVQEEGWALALNVMADQTVINREKRDMLFDQNAQEIMELDTVKTVYNTQTAVADGLARTVEALTDAEAALNADLDKAQEMLTD